LHQTALEMMTAKHYRHLPIIDESSKDLLGIIDVGQLCQCVVGVQPTRVPTASAVVPTAASCSFEAMAAGVLDYTATPRRQSVIGRLPVGEMRAPTAKPRFMELTPTQLQVSHAHTHHTHARSRSLLGSGVPGGVGRGVITDGAACRAGVGLRRVQTVRHIITRAKQSKGQMQQMNFSGAIVRLTAPLQRTCELIRAVDAAMSAGKTPTLAQAATLATLHAIHVRGHVLC
jgi:hypothetical protein